MEGLNLFRLLKRLFHRQRKGSGSSLQHLPEVVILAPGDSASIAYYVAPHLESQGITFKMVSQDDAAGPDLYRCGCRCLILIRYLPTQWVQSLRRFRHSGGKIVYFMDDDLMDGLALEGLPNAYQRKLRRFALRQRSVIEELSDSFWVGSAFLASKYSAWNALVLAPTPSASLAGKRRLCSICYHGTASHQSELAWLVQVLENTQASSDDCTFEVFGDSGVNRMYRSIPAVAVLHPMNWQNYLAYSNAVQRDIALAPLLPQPFNSARGPTKFFDFARMGAVGIYTDVPPYQGFIRDGIDGILLPNDPKMWSEAIIALSLDVTRRKRMALAALQRSQELAWNFLSRNVV